MAKYGIVTKRDVKKPLVVSPPSEELVKTLVQSVDTRGGGKDDLNSRILAGFPFLGQFLGHDITNDSSLNKEPSKDYPENHSTPALDLNGLYGSGPTGSPDLYDPDRLGRFFFEEEAIDLPRNQDPQRTARIGDQRNDRNLILAQLHLAFLKFHNTIYNNLSSINDVQKDDRGNIINEDPFEKTQRLVRWHYQWVILREFLPLLVGSKMVLEVLTRGPQWYQPTPKDLFIPLEFSTAAYRSGHSQIHYLYRINDGIRLPLFSAKEDNGRRQDLQGGYIDTKAHAVDWKYFFDTTTNVAPGLNRASKAIKPRLVGPFLFPPPSVALNRKKAGDSDSLASKALAVRDLERGEKRELPSGQEVGKEMQSKGMSVAVLDGQKDDFDKALCDALAGLPHSTELEQETPLWYFILKEAEVQYKGEMLGDVGGRIVAEVIIKLLQADPNSLWKEVDLAHLYDVLAQDNRLNSPAGSNGTLEDRKILSRKVGTWKPSLSTQRAQAVNNDFTITDLLIHSSV